MVDTVESGFLLRAPLAARASRPLRPGRPSTRESSLRHRSSLVGPKHTLPDASLPCLADLPRQRLGTVTARPRDRHPSMQSSLPGTAAVRWKEVAGPHRGDLPGTLAQDVPFHSCGWMVKGK